MGLSVAIGPMAWVGALVFVGILAMLLVGALGFSRARNIRSVWFWVASVLGAIVAAYAATLVIFL